MTWVAAGTAVAVVGTGIVSSRAAKSAAKTAAEGAERSGAQIQAAGDLARRDVQRIFPQAQGDLIAGASGAADILGQGVTEQQRLLSAGNVGAQGTLQGGFSQVQNALLGVPVNQQAFAPQQIPLSQPLQNPIGQATGGGVVEGGLFSNLGQNVEQNRLAEEDFSRVQDLVKKTGFSNIGRAESAQRELLELGLDRQGRQINEAEVRRGFDRLTQKDTERLIKRAKLTGKKKRDIRDRARAALARRGLDNSGNPLGNT